MQTDTRPNVSHYTYRLSWSADDAEYVATCAEFRSLSWVAGSQVEALQGLEQLLVDVVADMAAAGEHVPQPFAERAYSGKFNLRVGELLHRELAMHAAEDGLSLNQYVVRKLTAAG
ncbi:type II toxin-antitoxin system HicB family antitoxin [Nocardioides renjunii]|uniref:type II toxin-antitoxin system HicB family antitoxin n=1 Tax=Nocardioides renjunii TaxID=3095075 RepID=UPI002AFFFF54|nr:type II toxin-antitoxin system HicB family antitoxin [Nocardioides sp. S-34]WQQ24417.1 type II toxin-antitoxin system HicB family antitoxin [Nocardioides sp. S-34]